MATKQGHTVHKSVVIGKLRNRRTHTLTNKQTEKRTDTDKIIDRKSAV